MAYRKVNDTSRASVADAIREKGGTSDALVFPEGFVSAISAIQTGAAEPVLQEKTVTYTSNGTNTITPDGGYDGLSSVDVTVDVASVSTVTINCESNDSYAFWLSPDGVFHNNQILNAGANTIIATPYSPIGVYNTYGYPMKNLNNIVDSGGNIGIRLNNSGSMGYFRIYYATAITASATQPTD